MAAFLSRWSVELVAAVWLFAALSTLLWMWGLNPLVFPAQDEAVVRQAAQLVHEHGNPFLSLPFADPEDIAHPRGWLTLANNTSALPTYAPVSFYFYSLLLRLGTLGSWLIALLPAAAVAAFAAGTARRLPASRRALALLVPVLGFASFYWLMRPWMNVSSMLVCVCWAFCYWSLWVDNQKTLLLAGMWFSVAAAAAVRPDYAGALLLVALLFSLASNPARWKQQLLFSVLAGIGAVAPNLILNKVETGHALRAVYQLALDRQYGESATNGLDHSHGFSVLAVLEVLLVPMGVPTLAGVTSEGSKYLLRMGVTPLLLLSQLALIPLLRKKPWLSRLLYAAAAVLMALVIVSRLHTDLFGSTARVGLVHHSVPRYLAPVYLFLPLSPILLLGRCQKPWLLLTGSALCFAVTAGTAYDLYEKQVSSLAWVRHFVEQSEAQLRNLDGRIPSNAIVYSAGLDKVLWSKWPIAFIEGPEKTAASLSRASLAGVPAYVVDPGGRNLRKLSAPLQRRGLQLTRVDARRGIYRSDPLPKPATVTEPPP